MNHELNDLEAGATLDSDNPVSVEEDRKGCELINGKWVEKDPVEVEPEEDRKWCELFEGV